MSNVILDVAPAATTILIKPKRSRRSSRTESSSRWSHHRRGSQRQAAACPQSRVQTLGVSVRRRCTAGRCRLQRGSTPPRGRRRRLHDLLCTIRGMTDQHVPRRMDTTASLWSRLAECAVAGLPRLGGVLCRRPGDRLPGVHEHRTARPRAVEVALLALADVPRTPADNTFEDPAAREAVDARTGARRTAPAD